MMKRNKHMKTTTNIIYPAFALLVLALGWLVPAPTAQATCQQGCLANGNTVLGEEALVNSSPGLNNTAIGINALHADTGGFPPLGSYNTATGAAALANNTTGGLNTATGPSALQFNTTGSGNIAVG